MVTRRRLLLSLPPLVALQSRGEVGRWVAKDDGADMKDSWGQGGLSRHPGGERAALFGDGNFGMFIHFGLYSHLGGMWKGEIFYGIGEWIMRQKQIPVEEYQAIAREFDPVDFDAAALVALAREAGMRWIIMTSKHHDGFALFHSAHPFCSTRATPAQRDYIGEMATACAEAGMPFGVYYSHFQDWTEPGGSHGPAVDAAGRQVTFEEYFRSKCEPQVRELCTQYGPLAFVWFDTPGAMPEALVRELGALVRELQPEALLGSRIGHGMGDYETKGDMEIPDANSAGLWEVVDVTNDSWGYCLHDRNWKSPAELLRRLLGTVARGGSYLLNVGPDGRGRIPRLAADALRATGGWLQAHPDAVYGTSPSPWGRAMAWGDATLGADHSLHLLVFDEPRDGWLWLPGLETPIASASILDAQGEEVSLAFEQRNGVWRVRLRLIVDDFAPLAPSAVRRVKLGFAAAPSIRPDLALVPNLGTDLTASAAVEVVAASRDHHAYMEKFGEWKSVTRVHRWTPESRLEWEVEVQETGDWKVEIECQGQGQLAWTLSARDGGAEGFTDNLVTTGPVYARAPLGVIRLEGGRRRLSLALTRGNAEGASVTRLRLTPWLACA